MLVRDMKNACMEEIIELQRADNNDKKEYFKENQAVRLTQSQGDYVVVTSYDITKYQRFVPINEHSRIVLQHIADNSQLCLCEVIHDKSDKITIIVKQYPMVNEMDISVLVKDEFIRTKMKKQKYFQNIYDPYPELKKSAVFSPEDSSEYFVIGKHIRKDEIKNEAFVIVTGDYYLSIRKRSEYDSQYYEAEKFSRGINASNYCFMLAHGSLNFSSEKSEIKDKVRSILPDRNDLYIDIWNQYEQIETEVILDRMKDAGAIRFDSYEPLGMAVNFFLNEGRSEKQLSEFAAYVKKGDMVSILPFNPFQNVADAVELRNIFSSREINSQIVEGKVAEDIIPESGRLSIAINDENYEKLLKFDKGYIVISFKGDNRRIERREDARRKIETMSCPMPELNAILEGKRATKPQKTNIPPLSPTLLTDTKFSNLTPNQIEAIRIALNTPDIAIIQGPPGTGKTTVITAIVKRLEEEADTESSMFGRSLITAFQHDAVQNATDRLRILGLPAIKFGKKYSDIEDDSSEINLSIQHWIDDKLTDLNIKHADTKDIEYITEFNRLYVNYMKSSVSLEQTLNILERISEEVGNHISLELNNRLLSVIKSLKYQITDRSEDNSNNSLIKVIRRIPTNETAMEDDGRNILRMAVWLLKDKQDDYLVRFTDELDNMTDKGDYDYERLTVIKREILAHIIPLDRIFTGQGKRDEVDELLCDISENLQKQIKKSKNGEDLIFLEYIQALEDDPMAVKKAILDYSVVNGATNQQVISKEISTLKNNDIVYDNVLVDEAARSNPLDLFIPLSVAKKKIILVGDHRQLPHIIDDEIVKKMEGDNTEVFKEDIENKLKKSMFQQLFYKLQELEKQDGIIRVITLDTQFRMHPSIGSFVNRNFYKKYGENVENGITDAGYFGHDLPGIENKACVWYDTPLKLGRERSAKSKSREIEAWRIAEHLKKMLGNPHGKELSYGIITFYRDQVNLINNVLASEQIGILNRDENEHYSIAPKYRKGKSASEEYIRVGTVDAFQGREFDVVYLSMVRSNAEKVRSKPQDKNNRQEILARDKELKRKYGFLMFENRLCVAMSRAKKLMICVGDSGMLQDESAKDAIPSLIDFYNMCNGDDEYGCILK